MNRKSIIAITIVAAVTLLGAGVLFAGQHGGEGRGMHGGGGMFGHLGRLRAELNLTDAQADQIKQIVSTLREQNEPYRKQLHGGIKSIAETLLKNPSDTASAQVILGQQDAAERALKANILTATSQALSVLTPEQRAKLGTILEKHHEEMESRMSGFQERMHGRHGW